MWKWVKAEAAYYILAIKECQSWKGYRAMMRLSRWARISAIVLFGGIGVITVINFLLPYLPKVGWMTWLTIGLSVLLFGLISVIHFLGRSYDRAMRKAKSEFDSEVKYQKEYMERKVAVIYAIAVGRTLCDQLDNGQVTAQCLARWRSDTVSDLARCLGSDRAMQFYGQEQYDPPSTETEQRAWLQEYVDRLGSIGAHLQTVSISAQPATKGHI